MTDKSIFVYKLLLSLNISHFSLFLGENCNPPEKGHLPLSQQLPLKIKILPRPPSLNIWLKSQSPSRNEEGGGSCTL